MKGAAADIAGEVLTSDLGLLLSWLGYHPEDHELQELVTEIDRDKSGNGGSLYVSLSTIFFEVFRGVFKVFTNFFIFLEMFGPIRTHSDLFGCVPPVRLNAYGCVWRRVAGFGRFQILSGEIWMFSVDF